MTSSNDHYIINNWEDEKLNLKNSLLRGIYSFGFEKPSSIQKEGLYSMVYNKHKDGLRDIIAQAQSGTGKTGLFVVGSLQIIDETKKEPQVIILAPTRELAEQSYNVANNLSHYMDIETILLKGGTSVQANKKELADKCPQLCIGTPGRVQDMIRRGCLKTQNL